MQARSEQTRHRLMRAGAEMFHQNGYAKATLEQIATAAGMTKGALYFHFASKDRLAAAVDEHGRAMLREFVEEQLRGGASPVQALVDLTHWLARTLYEDPVIRAGFRIAAESGGKQPSSTDVAAAWIHEIRRLLAHAREAGELRTDRATDPEGPETLLAATVCGIEVLSGTGMSGAELRRRVGALWEPLLSALVPPGDETRYRTAPPRAAPPRIDPPPVGPPSPSPHVSASLEPRSTTAA
ncbi:ScbR family autoregulator-binding transcription factor [Streptomyces sp. NPDC046324]|uniref:ScbR family autoregulator-binding transcription factor n=1 Tax=Streptomyces sp. NPDC046324 TaxID=3154915 RepID=UPI0033EA831D